MSTPDPHEDDRLSAYLDGELDPSQAADLEARLEKDPARAAALDAVSEVLVALRGLDEVEPPQGYTERLRARLAEARPAPADDVVHLADHPPLRSALRRRWLTVGGAAAAATLLGLVGGVLVRGGIRGPIPEAANAPVELRQEATGEDEGAPTLRLPSLSVPRLAIVDAETPLADEAAVRAHLAGRDEAKALLGTPVDQVPELADAARKTIAAAPLLRSGVAPDACLDAIEQAGLVAHVESVTYQGQPALAYVVASASDGSSKLDQVHVILVDPRTCAERLFI
ncbi:MAG: anti-sigma factor family protein [Egibacteraceae bacterium]